MTETTARTYHTMESLRQMAQTDLRNVNREELVEASFTYRIGERPFRKVFQKIF